MKSKAAAILMALMALYAEGKLLIIIKYYEFMLGYLIKLLENIFLFPEGV